MTFPEEKARERRKGEGLSGIIWKALLLCISSNNMMSTSEHRRERERERKKRIVPQNLMLVFCFHLVVSIEHYLFDETETRSSSPSLNIQL